MHTDPPHVNTGHYWGGNLKRKLFFLVFVHKLNKTFSELMLVFSKMNFFGSLIYYLI